jgi:CRISPR/Cas system endoribonuclease Cas6 (RAMP superfamily)
MKFGGRMGSTGYEGILLLLLTYLNFGQWIHVGKNATFGLGKYEILSL